MSEIDLDRLADAYRLRPMSSHARQRARSSADGCSGWLLDIGGGVGSHAATWSEAQGVGSIRPIVVDPSPAMLSNASRKTGVGVLQAEAQRLPLRDRSCGLAYFHLSIHYGDWVAAMDEAFRVVVPGGRIEVWTIAPAAIERSSLGRWFPTVIEIDTVRFPDPAAIARHCGSIGATVAVSVVSEPILRLAGEWAAAVRGRFVSTLQLLDDEEIEHGLARFATEFPDEESEYRYQLELTRISIVVQPLR